MRSNYGRACGAIATRDWLRLVLGACIAAASLLPSNPVEADPMACTTEQFRCGEDCCFKSSEICVTRRCVEKPGPGIAAIPGGPYDVRRGEQVTLDGSHSRPSKDRRITTYTWKLTPTNCPNAGFTVTMTGARVTFTALCNVTAQLTVADGGPETDSKTAQVYVRPRQWGARTTIDVNADVTKVDMLFDDVEVASGRNRCAQHSEEDDHEFHVNPERPATYEGAQYTVAMVEDEGPFQNVFYVKDASFALKRAIIVNSKLYKGGAVYEQNARKSEQQRLTVERYAKAVEAHERMHSELHRIALRDRKVDDPAPYVEAAMGFDRDQMVFHMDLKIREAATRLQEESSEEKVAERLKRYGPMSLRGGGCIYYTVSSGNENTIYWKSFLDAYNYTYDCPPP